MESDDKKLSRAEINRLNSLKSTGPKTEAGKRKASLNALRHGLTAQTVVLPKEDLEEYERFIQRFRDDLKPVGMLEEQIAHSIAEDAWRMNRARALENNLFSLGIQEKADPDQTEPSQLELALAMAAALREQTKMLSTISMHGQRISRQFAANVEQLREIQAERRQQRGRDMLQAVKLITLHEALERRKPDPASRIEYNPANDGFDFTIDELDTFLQRKYRRDDALTYWVTNKIPKQAA